MIYFTKSGSLLRYASLSAYNRLTHFVTTRKGGCSENTYASFNCCPYCNDREENVVRNLQLLGQELAETDQTSLPYGFIIPHQIHKTQCLHIDRAFLSSSKPQQHAALEGVDALITTESGCCLCISTADCVPLLLYDTRHEAIAAIHAGWRGTVARIAEHTLQEMNSRFGTQGADLIATIGPSISAAAFEVGDEVAETFQDNGFDLKEIAFRSPENGKYHIDLWKANRQQLTTFGIKADKIETAGICTYSRYEDFFSARRLGINSGRILSGIGLK